MAEFHQDRNGETFRISSTTFLIAYCNAPLPPRYTLSASRIFIFPNFVGHLARCNNTLPKPDSHLFSSHSPRRPAPRSMGKTNGSRACFIPAFHGVGSASLFNGNSACRQNWGDHRQSPRHLRQAQVPRSWGGRYEKE